MKMYLLRFVTLGLALLCLLPNPQAAVAKNPPNAAAQHQHKPLPSSQKNPRFSNFSSHNSLNNKTNYAPDTILVKFKPAVAESHKEKLHKKHGSTKNRTYKALNIQRLKIKKGLSVEEAVSLYKADPDVAFAEPDFTVTASAVVPDDPYYGSSGSWGQAYQDLWGLHKIKAGDAWGVTRGSAEVVVAVSDSGLDFSHPDIQGKVWTNPRETPYDGIDNDGNSLVDDLHGWNFANNNNDPADDHGHGTHVSGTIAAATNNGAGVAGISWNTRIMPLKFLGSDGSGSTSDGAATIIYAADNGARVVNLSWGGAPRSQTLEDAINYAFSKGVVVVAAAGNNSGDAASFYPAGYENVLTVAATDSADKKAYFTNYGSAVEVSAPGVDILSLRAGATDMYGDGTHIVGTNYYRASGTSMAAPHVSGLAALLFSQHPDWSSSQVMAQIVGTTDPIGDDTIGSGRINAFSAVVGTPTRTRLGYLGRSISEPSGNGLLDSGETAQVTVSIKNYAAPTGATVTLSTTDPYVTVLNGTAVFGSIGSWQRVDNSASPFVLSVAPDVPSLHKVNFLVTVTASNGVDISTASFEERITSSLPGWPVQTGGRASTPVVLADLDGDGVAEALTYSDKIYVLRGDGTSLPGWPQPLPDDLWGSTLAVGDLDGNGEPVVVAVGSSKVYAWNRDGSMKNGFPVSVGAPETDAYLTGTTLADLDGDGYLEIISLSYFLGQVYVWRQDGTLAPGWPVSIPQSYLFGAINAAVGDVDGDGYPEVLVTAQQDGVYAFKYDGTTAAGWPVMIPDTLTTISVGDTEPDGKVRVFISGLGGVLYGYNGDGSPAAGWPQAGHHPAIGDINGDGRLDIVADGFGEIYAYNKDGVMLPGWPQPHVSNTLNTPVLADMDGDGKIDVMVRTLYGIYGWRGDGTLLPEYPFLVDTSSGRLNDVAVALGDINGDGRIDLVTGSGASDYNVYAIPLPGPYQPRLVPWPMHQHDSQQTSAITHRPVIAPSALAGVKGVSLNHRLVAKGGFPPYSWQQVDGTLPPGLTLDPATGTIYGSASEAGTFTFTVQVSDANAFTAARAVTATIEVMAITTTSLPAATIGSFYSQTVAAAGGTAPYRWKVVAGELPTGLTLSPLSGAITGYPTISGTSSFTLQALDAEGLLATRAFTIVTSTWSENSINGISPSAITVDTTGNLYLAGSVWNPYSLVLAKYGPSGNLIWQRSFDGDNATSLAVDAAGNVYLAGYYLWEKSAAFVRKYDAAGKLLWTREYANGMSRALTVDAAGNVYLAGRSPSNISDNFLAKYDSAGNLQWVKPGVPGLPSGIVVDEDGNVYSAFGTILKYDAAGNQLWARWYGDSSAGIALDRNNNMVVAGGNSLNKYDAAGKQLWTVQCSLTGITSLVVDRNGNSYITGYAFGYGVGADVITMKYDAAGTLIWTRTHDFDQADSGDALAVDQNSTTLYVAVSYQGGSKILRYVQPVITTTALADATVNEPYSASLTATSGAAPYTWTVASGALPPGLVLDSSTGLISGIPVQWGNFQVALRATGVTGDSDMKILPLNIHPPATPSLADFSAGPLAGYAPLLVNFTDASTNAPSSWSWIFGDGGSSSEKDPSHLYLTPGSYTVSLTTTGPAGSETITKPFEVTVLACTSAPVKLRSAYWTPFTDIVAAYAAAVEFDTIELLAVEQGGTLEINRDIWVNLRGGYDCAYGDNPSVTTMTGNLRVTSGTVNLVNLRFR